MKALGYFEKHDLKEFSIREVEVALPELREQDVLVRVKAFSTNPVDTKVRRSREAQDGRPVILGWDASGVIEKVGKAVKGFVTGDEVYYAGDLYRDGSYAEYQAIDARLIARKPRTLSHAAAAALPLTAITAWEALLERKPFPYTKETKILVIGGAGGVGSITTQLLKTLTPATVITTASRPETVTWAKEHGADIVLDHRNDLRAELEKNGIREVDVIFGTTQTSRYLPLLPQVLRPFGHFVMIDDGVSIETAPLKVKSITVQTEMMFTKSTYDYKQETQGAFLAELAELVDKGKIASTANTVLKGFTAENVRLAHELQESGKAIGKIVIDSAA